MSRPRFSRALELRGLSVALLLFPSLILSNCGSQPFPLPATMPGFSATSDSPSGVGEQPSLVPTLGEVGSESTTIAAEDAQTDWDLVMLRLVNRARSDPAGEASRLGSSVVDIRAALAPLAYDRSMGKAATNHNAWMHLNIGGISSGRTPDSFTHYETEDGNSNGTPAASTPGYTGASLGQRVSAVGFDWGSVGENILTGYSSDTIIVNEAKMIANHKSWWESAGHRDNMLTANYAVFGHHAEARTFMPPLGGLNAPFDNLLFATEDFGQPQASPRTYIFGVLYGDLDGNNSWTARDAGAPNREGLPGVAFTVRSAGTPTIVAGDTTMDNGAFSARVGDGVYDIIFTGSELPGGAASVFNVTVSGSNLDLGDVQIASKP